MEEGSHLPTDIQYSSNDSKSENDSDVDMDCSYCSNSSSLVSSHSSSYGEGVECGGLTDLESKALQHFLVCEEQDPSSPILSYSWQAKKRFDNKGGCFQRTGSDVKLYVPPGAIVDAVEVCTSVSVDLSDIRHILSGELSGDEQVVSPFAEFWAGQDFQFQKHVSITLPHFLPKNVEPTLVNVYHLRRNSSNDLVVCRLPRYNAEVSGLKDEAVAEIKDHFFQLAEGHITICTETFSGYVCTYCQKMAKKGQKYKPELYIMASGSVLPPSAPELPPSVDIYAHIWDKRIFAADFRVPNGIALGDSKPVELLNHKGDSELELSMRNDCDLEYRLDCHGQLLHPGETKCEEFRSYIGCKKCAAKQKLRPMSHQWAMKSEKRNSEHVEVVVEVTHRTITNQSQKKTALVLQLSMTQRMSATTQTDNGVQTENTQAKQLASGPASSSQDSVSGSASGGGVLTSTHGSDNGSTSHSQEACMEQQRGNQRPVMLVKDCTFNVNHTNNVESAEAINCGNTHTTNSTNILPAAEGASHTLPEPPQHQQLPQPIVPFVEEPDEEMDDFPHQVQKL